MKKIILFGVLLIILVSCRDDKFPDKPIISAFSCPTGFIAVLGNGTLGTSDFCVAKYEMKGTSGNISSVEAGTPYVSINANNSFTECSGMSEADFDGGTFALISNPEWMTVARDIEGVAANWSGSAVGSWCVFKGNSGTNATCEYDGDETEGGSGRDTKARLFLSSGEEIWDFAGNAGEWVDWDSGDAVFTIGPTDADGASWREITSLDGSVTADDLQSSGGYSSTQGMGLWIGGAGGTAQRGGESLGSNNSGVYMLTLGNTPNAASPSPRSGFRCVWRP